MDTKINISELDLGTIKATFLSQEKKDKVNKILSKEEIAKYLCEIHEYSKEEKLKMAIIKLNESLEKGLDLVDEAYLTLLLKSIPFDKSEADIYWEFKDENGIYKETKNVLIEIAAIHPLVDGKPGKEFLDHLIQGINLYNKEVAKGNNPIIYIPGSLHYVMDKEKNIPLVDLKPLAEAEKCYLIEQGISEDIIFADDANQKYREYDGTYNSADECYVAVKIAKDHNCGRILSVVSPGQLYRKALFYQEFGYNPEVYATGSENTLHNYVGELFWSLYITYMNDQDWQNSFMSYLTRKERDIDYPNKISNYKNYVDQILSYGPGISEDILKIKANWMDLYNEAKSYMDNANENNENILIDLVRVKDKETEEIERILDIIKLYPDKKIVIVYNNQDNIEDIKKISDENGNIILKCLDNNDAKNISKEFKNGKFKKLFGMYPSALCMKKAIQLINNGVIPVVSSLPEENSKYLYNISCMFDEVIYQNIKNNNYQK